MARRGGGAPVPGGVLCAGRGSGETGGAGHRLAGEVSFFIVSDPGSTRLHGEMSANQWLLEQGFMARRSSGRNPLVGVKDLLKKLGITRKKLTGLLGQDVTSKIQLKAATMDWGSARAYNNSALGIRINLAGRETLGCVPPEEYDGLREEIMAGLRALRDDAGDEVIAEVHRAEEIYDGEHAGEAPDIVFLFREDKLYTAYTAGFWPRVFRELPDKQADHSMTGIFVAHGGGIAASEQKLSFRIWDVLPTMMHLGSREVPAVCDGRVLAEILAGGAGDVVYDEDWRRFLPEGGELTLDQTDVDEINEHMKDLGYMQ